MARLSVAPPVAYVSAVGARSVLLERIIKHRSINSMKLTFLLPAVMTVALSSPAFAATDNMMIIPAGQTGATPAGMLVAPPPTANVSGYSSGAPSGAPSGMPPTGSMPPSGAPPTGMTPPSTGTGGTPSVPNTGTMPATTPVAPTPSTHHATPSIPNTGAGGTAAATEMTLVGLAGVALAALALARRYGMR